MNTTKRTERRLAENLVHQMYFPEHDFASLYVGKYISRVQTENKKA